MKTIAGSIMIGFGLLAQVVNEWSRHNFYALFNLAKGAMLEGGGSFTPAAMYSTPESVGLSLFTQILIWVFIAFGFFLVLSGLDEEKPKKK